VALEYGLIFVGKWGQDGEVGDHVPVLLTQVLAAAQVRPGQRWIDGTFGRGGHARALLEQGALVLGLDQDSDAAEAARLVKERWPENFEWKQRNFRELKTCSVEHGWDFVDGVLLDLGVSSPQLESAERGFSFRMEGPLDMRMDRRGGKTAADLVNELSEEELSKIFYEKGGERDSRRVARIVVARREQTPFGTTTDLAGVVAAALPQRRRAGGIHPATKVFQALRIAVNGEEEALLAALPQAVEIMRPGGVLAVISFHSGEDRAVKQFMRKCSSPYLDTPARPNTLPNPQNFLRDMKRYLPTDEEMAENPRARSARLRVAVRNEVLIQ
jgi:16S rRNA (cytosine1402-N4)-methyltransferase